LRSQWRYPVDEGHLKISRIVLFLIVSEVLLGIACGPQHTQQGTWSRDDGFRHKTTLGIKETTEKPSNTVR